MEVSVDGGNSWIYVSNDKLSGNKYYGTTYATYDNSTPVNIRMDMRIMVQEMLHYRHQINFIQKKYYKYTKNKQS